MGLLGQGWEDPQSNAIMQLAGGLLSGNFGQGAAAYGTTMAGAKDAAMKRQYMQAQMDNYASEIDARKLATVKDARHQSLIEGLFGGTAGAPASTQGGTGQPDASQTPAQAGGTGSPGNSGAASTGGSLIDLARQYGIPDKAIQADIVFNGGKGISAMLEKHGARDMQVTNGYAYDKNKQGTGFMPSFTTTPDGKGIINRIDPDGLPVSSIPKGALDSYNAYRGADANFKPIKVYNPATGREEYTNEGAVVGGQRPAQGGTPATPGYANEPQMKAAVGGSMGADPAAIQREIRKTQNDLMKPLDEPSKALLRGNLADLQRQAQRPGVAQSGNFAAGPSADEAAAAEARRATLVDTAKADVQSTQGRQAGMDSAMNAYKLVDQALLHPGLRTATGLSGKLDPRNYIPGTDAKNFDSVAKQLQGNAFLSAFAQLKGAGQITEVEGDKAAAAIARLQQSQSTEEYRTALKDYQSVIGQGLKRMGVDPTTNTGGASGSYEDKPAPAANKPPPPQAMKGMVRGGYKFKGGNPSDQANWEKM